MRIYPELRAAQVKRDGDLTEADGWYFKRNYDLGANDPGENFTAMSTLRSIRALASGRVGILEVPELLWARELPRTLLLLLVHKVCTRGGGRRVFYAIENNDPGTALFGNKKVPRLFLTVAIAAIGTAIRLLVDSIAFGSEGAQRAYKSLPFIKNVETELIEELPGRPDVPPLSTAERDGAVFVGALEARKGVLELCSAWERIETALPDSTLRIIGRGPLEQHVKTWAAVDPRRHFMGALPHDEVISTIGRSTVLVAPSKAVGRWREQIGLPIKEALSAGTTVVASPDSGLARWLIDNGHHVVRSGESDLAVQLASAIRAPLDPNVVIAALPTEDGRVTADRWLHKRSVGRE